MNIYKYIYLFNISALLTSITGCNFQFNLLCLSCEVFVLVLLFLYYT